MAENDDSPWYRSLLAGLGAIVGVAVLVGGVISLVALGAVSITGLGDTSSTPRADSSLYIPKQTGAPDRSDDPGLTLADLNGGKNPQASGTASANGQESPSAKADQKRTPKPKPKSVVSLSASPTSVAAMQQIYLSGTYPGGEGATLQVQRLEGGSWNNFPTSASVSGGSFSTYVMTGQKGPNKFRVVDVDKGKKSNVVTVTVR